MPKQGLIGIFNDKDLKTSVKNIKCPIHHAVKPGCIGYEIEPSPLLKNMTAETIISYGLKPYKFKKDRWGNKIPKWSEHYQPEVSAMYLKERVYHHTNPVCIRCRKCFQ